MLAPGTRVRLIGSSATLRFRVRPALGTVARPDQWDGYVIVHLDVPAIYDNQVRPPRPIGEIRWAEDNLKVLAP